MSLENTFKRGLEVLSSLQLSNVPNLFENSLLSAGRKEANLWSAEECACPWEYIVRS